MYMVRFLRMSDIIFCHASSVERRAVKRLGELNNGYHWKVLLKLRLMDGLSKKIIALQGKWACVSLVGERV